MMSNDDDDLICIAFEGSRRIAAGPLAMVRPAVQAAMAKGADRLLVFEVESSRPVEIAPAGAAAAALPASPRARGRPKLGVVAREVTLLPRHWEWLGRQPGGASVALRRLVEDARRSAAGADEVRAAREATYRFIYAMGGDFPGFEEASRALFRGDRQGFLEHLDTWPPDVRAHARTLAERALAAG